MNLISIDGGMFYKAEKRTIKLIEIHFLIIHINICSFV